MAVAVPKGIVPFFSIFAALGILTAATGLLSTAYRSQQRARAVRYEREGGKRAAIGDFNESVRHYRAALTFDPHSLRLKLALAEALVRQGKPAEAATYLLDVLHEEPGSGEANLMLARLNAAEGKSDEAESRYHQAIFAFWPRNGPERRAEGRMELVKFLLAAGKKTRAAAELLQWQSELAPDAQAQLTVGEMLISANAEAAARVLRDYAAFDPAAFEPLGKAEMANRQFVSARSAFRRAVNAAKEPSPKLRSELDLAETVVSLDPTPARLRTSERLIRAVRLLETMQAEFADCGGHPPELPVKKERDPDVILDLTEKLWSARREYCPAATPGLTPVSLVMAKIRAENGG